jgi:hypothetical protein
MTRPRPQRPPAAPPPNDWEVDTDPQREAPLPSVVLDPELEKVAVRQHGPKTAKEKKPRSKK